MRRVRSSIVGVTSVFCNEMVPGVSCGLTDSRLRKRMEVFIQMETSVPGLGS
jgi:hypothetical protein